MDVITFPENLKTTSGLSILLHGVISLQDASHMIMHIFDISRRAGGLKYAMGLPLLPNLV